MLFRSPSTAAVFGTYCGLAINPRMQVIDVFGEIIPGLLAAGEIVGGFHGGAYMTGSSLGKAAIFGRIAGRSAATAALERNDLTHANVTHEDQR